MPYSSPLDCDSIVREIEELKRERAELQQLLAQASPIEKPILIREIREITLQLVLKQQEFQGCLHPTPPAPLPDLVAQSVFVNVNHATRKISVSTLTTNIGQGNARGPFRIDLAVTMYRGNTVTSFVRTFEVPAGVILFGQPVLTTGIAALTVPGGVTPTSDYITEKMEVPLGYRDESPSSVYEFEFLVDSEQIIAETNNTNNRFFARWWTTTPAGIQRETPFKIESSVNSNGQKPDEEPVKAGE